MRKLLIMAVLFGLGATLDKPEDHYPRMLPYESSICSQSSTPTDIENIDCDTEVAEGFDENNAPAILTEPMTPEHLRMYRSVNK